VPPAPHAETTPLLLEEDQLLEDDELLEDGELLEDDELLEDEALVADDDAPPAPPPLDDAPLLEDEALFEDEAPLLEDTPPVPEAPVLRPQPTADVTTAPRVAAPKCPHQRFRGARILAMITWGARRARSVQSATLQESSHPCRGKETRARVTPKLATPCGTDPPPRPACPPCGSGRWPTRAAL
jgi:hypothetical protein